MSDRQAVGHESFRQPIPRRQQAWTAGNRAQDNRLRNEVSRHSPVEIALSTVTLQQTRRRPANVRRTKLVAPNETSHWSDKTIRVAAADE